MGSYYPLLVNLKKVKCLVIGGGEVACRKTRTLLNAGAQVTLISPEVDPSLRALADQGEIRLIQRNYQKGDLQGFRLVFAALDDARAGAEIAVEAEKEGVFLNLAAEPNRGNFIVPAHIEQGDLLIAFSTNGKSPLLSQKLRRELTERYGPEYAEFTALLGRERDWALQEIPEAEKRKAYFAALVYSDLLDLIKSGDREKINQKIKYLRKKILLNVCKRRES